MSTTICDPMKLFECMLSPPTRRKGNEENGLNGRTTIKPDHRDKMMAHFIQQVTRMMPMEDFIGKYIECTRAGINSKLECVKPFFKFIPSYKNFKDEFIKRNDKAAGYLGHVQLAFVREEFGEAFKMCRQAMAYAPPGGYELTCCFYWRALILDQLKDWHGAVRDLQLALETCSDLPEKLCLSIENLKLKLINGESSSVTENCNQNIDTSEQIRRQSFVNNLFSLKYSNPLAPALEKFVQIKSNSDRGRHLVVTEDVPMGTTLLVESPVVSILDETLSLNTIHCHHCLKRKFCRIPCPNCVFALFCDEDCLASAQIYHQFECPCLPDLHGILREGVAVNFYLAFKLICQMGPHALYSLFKETQGNGTEKLNAFTNLPVYNSVDHLEPMFESDQIIFPLISLMLAHILQENCPTFFEIVDPNCVPSFVDFTALKILDWFERFWKNVFSLGVVAEFESSLFGGDLMSLLLKDESKSNLGGEAYEYEQFASRIFPTASLINHSCHPNVKMFSQLTFGKCVIISTQSLSKGSELLISYGPLFFAHDKHQRQKQLMRSHNFECDCGACHDDWPGLMSDHFGLLEPQFVCPCGSSEEPNWQSKCNILDRTNNFKCQSCSTQFVELELVRKLEGVRKNTRNGRLLLENGSLSHAQETFTNVLTRLEKYTTTPSFDFILNQELFCETLYKIIHSLNDEKMGK